MTTHMTTRLPGSTMPCRTRLRTLQDTLVLACALALTACGGGGGGSSGGSTGGGSVVPTVTAKPALIAATDATLTQHFQTALGSVASNLARAESSGAYTTAAVSNSNSTTPGATADASTAAPAATSTTTFQELGVDEADVVKTDGNYLYSIDRSASAPALLQRALPATGATLGTSRQIPLTMSADARLSGFYLDTDRKRFAAIGGPNWGYSMWDAWFYPTPWMTGATEVAVGDTTNPAAITQSYRLRLTAQLIGSRRVGSVLYLVMRNAPVYPAFDYSGTSQAKATNETLIAGFKAQQGLPTISVNGGTAQTLVTPDSCYLVDGNQGVGTDVVTLLALDLASSAPSYKARCVAGGMEAFYMSTNAIYLSTSQYVYTSAGNTVTYTGTVKTDIHKLALNGLDFTYKGSGRVDGHLGWDQNRKSFRFGEHNGDLRVVSYTGDSAFVSVATTDAVTTAGNASSASTSTTTATTSTSSTASPATLSILRESSAKTLEKISTLPNSKRPEPLGKPGEQVYATRFIGNRGYVVTFRLTDPLYVLDLSDPTDPKVAGELQVSGYSDYLFPLTENLLLGVGKDAVVASTGWGDGRGAFYQGVKVSLIDVTDPTKPREAARQIIGRRGTDATVLHDHHGIAIKAQATATGFRVALPINLHETTPSYPTGSATDYYNYTATQLHRFEVATGAATLTAAAPVAAPAAVTSYGDPDISEDRAVITTDAVHWWRGGSWISTLW